MTMFPTLTDAELLRYVDAQHPCDPLVAELARRFGDAAGVTGDQHEMLEVLAEREIDCAEELTNELALGDEARKKLDKIGELLGLT